MKKLATTIAAIALIGTPAFAADMAVKAPPPAPPPAFNWTGWYVGVNGGLGVYAKESSVTGFNDEPINATTPSTTTGGALIDPVGGFGGGQIGYNWQIAPKWVVGLEADIQGGSIRDSGTVAVNNFRDTGGLVILMMGRSMLTRRPILTGSGQFAPGLATRSSTNAYSPM